MESGEFDTKVIVDYMLAGKPGTFDAVGNGPIDAVKRGLQLTFGMNIRVLDYEEQRCRTVPTPRQQHISI